MTDSIHRELELDAAPTRVWGWLTDAPLLSRWLADEVALELAPGGEARFRIGERIRSGWIEEVCPPPAGPDANIADRAAPAPTASPEDPEHDCARLTFWWSEDGEPASRVQLTLRETGRGTTRLRIVESRPLQSLDRTGIPLAADRSTRRGPALVAA